MALIPEVSFTEDKIQWPCRTQTLLLNGDHQVVKTRDALDEVHGLRTAGGPVLQLTFIGGVFQKRQDFAQVPPRVRIFTLLFDKALGIPQMTEADIVSDQ